MEQLFDILLKITLAGIILLAGIFILRGLFKFAWRMIRVALILMVVVLAAGYFLGFLEPLINMLTF